MSDLVLNAANVFAPSLANGPGARAVVHVQGCTLRCKGCHNDALLEHRVAQLLPVDVVLDWYRRLDGIRGLTLSGGEPFEQAMALAALAEAVRGLGGDVIVFSGYRIESLRVGVVNHAAQLLAQTDLLIDGSFREDLRAREPLRGSSNQRLHFLSSRILPQEITDLPEVEILSSQVSSVVSGFSVSRWSAEGLDRGH